MPRNSLSPDPREPKHPKGFDWDGVLDGLRWKLELEAPLTPKEIEEDRRGWRANDVLQEEE